MQRVVIAFVGLVGCRQVLGIDEGVVVVDALHGPEDADDAADAETDARIPHDEDDDMILDQADNCPATSNTDQGGTDFVGQACDPRPAVAGDRIGLFLPFFPMGAPAELQMTNATFGNDFVELDNDDIRTNELYSAVRVATETMALSASNGALFELSIGTRACRVEECGASACLVADDGLMTSSQTIPLTIEGTMSLTQTASELRCTVQPTNQAAVTSSLAESTPVSDRVRLRANNTRIRVKNVTVYIAPP